MNTFYIISLGCAKNQCDSERLIASLTGIGLDRADTAEQADILIINTCGFIESAKQESIEVILDAADLRAPVRASQDNRRLRSPATRFPASEPSPTRSYAAITKRP